MNVRGLVTVAAVAACLAVFGRETEQVSVVENEIMTITVPFGIKSYAPSNKEVVRIEKISDVALRVTGQQRGRCDLEVRGDRELVQKYEITVLGDLATTLETLASELDAVPEVRAQIVGDSIKIDGEVSSIKNWEYLVKVLESYPGVRNFAQFYPGPDVLMHMKETIEQAGFTVQFAKFGMDSEKWPANTVALEINKNTRILTVQARVFTPEQKEKLARCLMSEKWLTLDIAAQQAGASAAGGAQPATAGAEFMIRCLYDVVVSEATIRLNVAYMALGESDTRTLGSSSIPEVHSVFSHLQNLIHGGGGSSTATIGASLDSTMRFMAGNGVSRMSQKGYTLLKSWDDKGAEFKSGGTLSVRVSGLNSGDLREVPYGFEINVKGGLKSESVADLDLDISISGVTILQNGDIDQKEDKSKQKILCQVGKTTVIGGFGQMVEERNLQGTPILRHTPILNWFVSESGKSISDRRLLILVSPEIVDGTVDRPIDAQQEIVLPVLDNIDKTVDQREEEKNSGFTGFWSWLNWFTF